MLSRYATPLTVGFFLISAVSGTALFFHWQGGWFHEMHEWLSMALLLPFGLHLWKNWTAMIGYVKRKTLFAPLAGCLVAAALFVAPQAGGPGGGRGGEPPFRALQLLTKAPLADLAPLLKTTPQALLTSLSQHGYKLAGEKDSLETVAAASGVPAMKILSELLPAT